VRSYIEALEGNEREEPRWRYWWARATELLGEGEAAAAAYRALSSERGYYGFLAADRVGRAYAIEFLPGEPSAEAIAALTARPPVRRTRELRVLGREVDARREWNLLIAGLEPAERAVAARLAHGWGWHGPAIIAAARSDSLDDLEVRFPLAHLEQVMPLAEGLGLDPAWVLAIARQESAFFADARSPAGALGLMQVMPATGRQIARWLDLRLSSDRQLLDPELSLRFGGTYLRHLLDRWQGHPLLATAAYNAGASRAERWRPTGAAMPGDLWVELVPFRETRGYLRRVLAYTVIYEHRLGRAPVPMSERLPPVPPRAG
jgi:soluble lytic murein transglycosylase